MKASAGGDIDSGGVDAAVSQHIRQLGDVFLRFVKRRGKQVPQIMREYLGGKYPGGFAECFQCFPNITAIHFFSGSGQKDRAGFSVSVLCVAQQLFPEHAGNQNGTVFPFTLNGSAAVSYRLHRDESQLRNPDTRGANGLNQKPEPFVLPLCRFQQTVVFVLSQFLCLVQKQTMLDFQRLDVEIPATPCKPLSAESIELTLAGLNRFISSAL